VYNHYIIFSIEIINLNERRSKMSETNRQSYIVRRKANQQDNTAAEAFEITNTHEAGSKGPRTMGQVTLLEGVGFEITMWCFEKDPRAIYHNPNDLVHTDSCMEAFINYYPELPEQGYLSVEMNANGAAHSSFGTGRHTRGFLLDRGLPHPEIKVEKLIIDECHAWRASTMIHLSLLNSLYGRCDFPIGHKMKANFYKCGDHTNDPHWCSWQPITRLDFHCPECFGDLIVE
jgi:hypothetical protein